MQPRLALLPELLRLGGAVAQAVDGDLPAIGPLGPALLDLLLLGEAAGVSVVDAVVDSGPPLGGALLHANGALGANGALNALALDAGRALDALRSGALAFDSLRSGALALDPLPRLGALGADPLTGLRTLSPNPLADLRTVGADPLSGLRPFGTDALLAALGRLRAGRGALRALLGAVSLLGALLGLAAVATLGVRRSANCDCRHGGDQKCLGHKKFQ